MTTTDNTITSYSLAVLAMIAMPPISSRVHDRMSALCDWPATVAILRAALLVEGQGVDLKLSPRGEVMLKAILTTPLPERVEEWRMPS